MRPLPAVLAVLALVLAGACGDDAGSAPGGAATTAATDGASSTTAGVDAGSTSRPADGTGSGGGPGSGSTVGDGITSAEDAAAFLARSWLEDDRGAALRHADPGAVEALFAMEAPPVESLEFIECDATGGGRSDCFLTIEGRPLIVEVRDLRVTRVDLGPS